MSGRVVHFEVPYDDADRARSFYSDVFGWKVQPVPEMQYDIVSTGPVTDQGMPSEPGYVGGGLTQRAEPVSRPVITIAGRRHRRDARQGPLERRLGRWREDPGRRHGLRCVLQRQRGQPDGALAERRSAVVADKTERSSRQSARQAVGIAWAAVSTSRAASAAPIASSQTRFMVVLPSSIGSSGSTTDSVIPRSRAAPRVARSAHPTEPTSRSVTCRELAAGSSRRRARRAAA